MKNMLKLMNMTCRSAISQIILLFLCVLLAEGTWLFLQLKNIELLYYHDMGINIMIILIGFILLLWIQVKRFTHFAKSGGLTRIQVLPVSKRSFIFGEVLFNYASVLLLASVPFLVWFMMIALQPFHFPFMNNLYAYATLLISITDWMPINAIECGCLLLILLGIAYIMVAFSFTAIDLDRRISLIMVLLITFVIILFLNMILFSSSLMLPYRYEIFAGEALLLILLLHRKLEHAFVRRKSI